LQDDQLYGSADHTHLLHLLFRRVPTPDGVKETAFVKAAYLTSLTKGPVTHPLVSSIQWLGTMQGRNDLKTLVELLRHPDQDVIATAAAKELQRTLLVLDALYNVVALHRDHHIPNGWVGHGQLDHRDQRPWCTQRWRPKWSAKACSLAEEMSAFITRQLCCEPAHDHGGHD
jgi:hypothetical protein